MSRAEADAAVSIPWGAWHAETYRTLRMPVGASVEHLAAAGLGALDDDAVGRAVRSPGSGAPLRESARGARSACIVVDDLARPTPASRLLPHVLAELDSAGVRASDVSVVVATGSHGPLSDAQVRAKVGDVEDRGCVVVSHDCRGEREPLAAAGVEYGDEELLLNARYLAADVRILIGCVLPHSFAGYSGGAKLVLPGIADLRSLSRAHKFVQLGLRGGGDPNENGFRLEAEAIAERIGVVLAVCVVPGHGRAIADIACGGVVDAHRAACAAAAEAFRTPVVGPFDCLVLNAYPKDCDLIQSLNAFVCLKGLRRPLLRDDGLTVLCTAASEGLGEHGLFAPGGANYVRPRPLRHLRGGDLWVLAPGVSTEEFRSFFWEGYRHFAEVSALEEALAERFGPGANIGVVPTAPAQQLTREASS